ncbi:MAG: hypothetical protein LBU64_13720 [Planctomycetota bacterium]|jgi:hypothetical protein|nr:hypothetical protein [Planctomycetota bacterium]
MRNLILILALIATAGLPLRPSFGGEAIPAAERAEIPEKAPPDAATGASPDAATGASPDAATGASQAAEPSDLEEEIGEFDPFGG